MGFFRSLYHSFYDAAWLGSVRNESRRGWFFLAFFATLIAVFYTLIVVIGGHSLSRWLAAEGEKIIPKDFRVDMVSGTLRVGGIIQPYMQRDPEGAMLFFLDTVSSSTPTIDSLVTKPTGEILLISRKAIEYVNAEGARGTIPFPNTSGSLDQATILRGLHWLASPTAALIGGVATFLIALLTVMIGHLVSLVLVALIAYGVARYTGRAWTYKQLFVVGLFVPAVPMIISAIFLVLGVGVPFVYSITLLAFILAIMVSLKPQTQAETSASAPENSTPPSV